MRILSVSSRSLEKKRLWTLANQQRQTTLKREWNLKNPEKRKEASKKYYEKNKAYYNAYSSLRTRLMQKAKIKSLTEFELLYIDEFYDLAKRRNLEVDHIIPLKHKNVCGLHIPQNLQMLSRSENAKKGNKFDEDVICIFKDTQ